MTRVLRAGLVGLGQMGCHHARVLRSLPGVEFVAAVDTRDGIRESFPDVEVLGTVADLVDRGVDMCVVSTPTVTHEPIGLQLAEAGVATLIEKPLAHDAKAAQSIVEAFGRTGTLGCTSSGSTPRCRTCAAGWPRASWGAFTRSSPGGRGRSRHASWMPG